jgi:hypothetical protein
MSGRFAKGRGKKRPVFRLPKLQKPTGRTLALLILNAVLLVGVLVSAVKLSETTHRLITQSAAAVWRGSSEMRFAQVSCFLPADEAKTQTDVLSFEQTLDSEMTAASLTAPEGGKLWDDAWSGRASLNIEGKKGTLTVKTIGVGGDWFLFHPLVLRSGSYLTSRDYMQDRVVLDEELAWSLFGSYDVAGMSVTINGRPYPIAGVVHRESDSATKKAYQDGPGMFMDYGALNAIQATKIDCYEAVLPDVVTGFAKNIVSQKFAGIASQDQGASSAGSSSAATSAQKPSAVQTGSQAVVIENSSRFSFGSLVKVLGDFGVRSMNANGILYPYWENAARLTEDYAALYLLLIFLFALCPAVCAVVLIVRFIKKGVDYAGEVIPEKIEEKIEEEKEKHYIKTGI